MPITQNHSQTIAATRFCPERKRILQGDPQNLLVHHWGRLCGHAGLFTSAIEVLSYAQLWLPGAMSPWGETWRSLALKEWVRGRGLGFMLPPNPQLPGNHVPYPAGAFGHTGFTGTSFMVFPREKKIGVLLTNRTHPSFANEYHHEVRTLFYTQLSQN